MEKIKKISISLLIAFVLCLPLLSLAAGTQSTGSGSGTKATGDSSGVTSKIVNPISANDINSLIMTILKGAIRIGIPIIALAIIYSGFLFVAARGNSEKIGKAKDSLMYTLIGAAILLGAWTIAQLISDTVLQIK